MGAISERPAMFLYPHWLITFQKACKDPVRVDERSTSRSGIQNGESDRFRDSELMFVCMYVSIYVDWWV